jgi:hypothetical protein
MKMKFRKFFKSQKKFQRAMDFDEVFDKSFDDFYFCNFYFGLNL